MHREHQSKSRVFTSGASVLARNFRGEPKWVPATVIAQTGPVSYTFQTADSVWRRHVDQLLQTPPMPVETSPDVLNCEPVQPVVPEQDSLEIPAPVADVIKKPNVSPSFTSPPDTSSTVQNKKTEVHADRRYPTRERRPPVQLSY